MTRGDDEPVSIKDYVDARFQDLLLKHEGDLKSIQAEIDRRFSAGNRELDLRFSQVSDRVQNMDEDRKGIHDHLDVVDAALERQKGRMSVYAVISGVVLVIISIISLFLDHIL